MDLGGFILIIEFLVFIISLPIGYFIIRKLTTLKSYSDTIIINHNSNIAKGKIIGNLLTKKTGKNGRLHIRYMSRDSYDNEIIEIIGEPNKILIHPKGTWSQEKAIMEILPDSAQDYVNNMLSKIERLNGESSIIYAQKEGLQRTQQHIHDIGEGEITNFGMSLMKKYVDEMMKTTDEKKPIKPGGYQTQRDLFVQ